MALGEFTRFVFRFYNRNFDLTNQMKIGIGSQLAHVEMKIYMFADTRMGVSD